MAQSKTQKVSATASDTGIDSQIAKGASPEEVEEANKAALEVQLQQRQEGLEAELAQARGDGAVGDRTYVDDPETGQRFLAATEGQPMPAWAEKMQEKSGGSSNTPSRSGPEATA